MKMRLSITAILLAAVGSIPALSDTLSVTAMATPSGSLYDYSYQFSISGSGADVDNIFLGSNDLSPLDVVIDVNGAPTGDWSWLGNDTPENYLQFFNIAGGGLGNGDTLDVTFTSDLIPSAAEFAVGLASSTGDSTNTVNNVLGPYVPTPEPATLPLLISALSLFGLSRVARALLRAALALMPTP